MTPGTPPLTYVTLLADESIHPRFEAALSRTDAILDREHPLHIGDEEISAGSSFTVTSPIDRGITIGRFQSGTADHAAEAIEAAHRAFPAWCGLDWTRRAEIIEDAARLMQGRMYDLAASISLEAGKNRFEAVAEVGEAIAFLRYYVDRYRQEEGFVREHPPGAPGEVCRSVLKPRGAWAVISPFNFPIALAAGMASAALLTGNTVVLKPAGAAPLSAFHLYEILVAAGVPPGAVNLVTVSGPVFGEVAVSHQEVAGIAFTGSREAGMWLYRECAARQPYPKPVITEMGSKNPCIVTASADLEAAAEGVARAAFGYAGQKCSACSRVYVEEGVAEEFLSLLCEEAASIRVGDPRDRETGTGPLIDERAEARFREAVAETRSAGGRVVAGGSILSGGICDRGVYPEPTIVTGLPRAHRLLAEELFVPVLAVQEVATFDEGIREANHTDFGLTAGIFSRNPREIDRFFREIRFGVCYANRRGGATTGAWPGSQPFGGWKASGSTGTGTGGPHYLSNFLREQAQTRVEPGG